MKARLTGENLGTMPFLMTTSLYNFTSWYTACSHICGLLKGFGDLDGAFHHQLKPHGLILVRRDEPGEAGVGLEQEWDEGAEHKGPAEDCKYGTRLF